MSNFAELYEQIRDVGSSHVTAAAKHFREEVRPRVLDLAIRKAELSVRRNRGEDVTTSEIAQAAEESNLLTEERAYLSAMSHDIAISALLRVAGLIAAL